MLALEGQSLKYSVNMLVFKYAGLTVAMLLCITGIIHIHLCPASPEIAVSFHMESYISLS